MINKYFFKMAIDSSSLNSTILVFCLMVLIVLDFGTIECNKKQVDEQQQQTDYPSIGGNVSLNQQSLPILTNRNLPNEKSKSSIDDKSTSSVLQDKSINNNKIGLTKNSKKLNYELSGAKRSVSMIKIAKDGHQNSSMPTKKNNHLQLNSNQSMSITLAGAPLSFSSHQPPGPPIWINLGLGKDSLMEQNDYESYLNKGENRIINSRKKSPTNRDKYFAQTHHSSSQSIVNSQNETNSLVAQTKLTTQQLDDHRKLDGKKITNNNYHKYNSTSLSPATKLFHVTESSINHLIDHQDDLLVLDENEHLSTLVGNGRQSILRNTIIQEQLRQIPCEKLTGLTKGQAQLCQLYKDHMPFVGLGAKMTIDECQYQFRKNRWNCSIQDTQSVFGPIVKTGVRETAFLNALSSASIVYTVARACRDGQLNNCGCSTAEKPKSVKQNWNWGGCGDNIDYAYKFSEEFVDLKERELLPPEKYKLGDESEPKAAKAKLDRKRLMNIHNNQAGRRAVIRKTKITCKCHGVSGSCSLVTCWQQLPNFRDIGDFLKERYDKAAEVKFSKHEGKIQLRNKRQNTLQRPTIDDLIYIEQSPDFCTKVDKFGFAGTSGRACNSSVPVARSAYQSEDSCHKMCCSRGYKTVRVIKSFKCNCKFKYCCKMECQICYQAQFQSVCN